MTAVDIAALYDAHAPFLARTLARLLGPGAHVEDLVQETFLVAHRKRASLTEGPELRGWLYRVARNLAQHQRRGTARRIRLLERLGFIPAMDAVDTHEAALRADDRARVQRAIASLSIRQREVVVLFELEELDGKEIARLLSIPEGTVWTRLHHGRKKLAECLCRDQQGSAA